MAPRCLAQVLMRVLLSALILVNAAAAESADPALENGYPPLWPHVPGDLEGFGKKDNHTVIDPWTYGDRMGICKTLLNYTYKYNVITGLNKSRNMLWGFCLLLEWAFESGRLADPSKNSNCGDKAGDPYCISPYSWFACIDYYWTTVPFLVAAKAGIFGNWQDATEILPPKECSNDFCYTYDSCYPSNSIAMDKWTLFFKTLMASTPLSEVPSAVDRLQHYMWEAHEASIDFAASKCKNRLRFASEPEADFDESLVKGVHFIGATRFPTDYENMKKVLENFPPCILKDNNECQLTPTQNTIYQMHKMLGDFNVLGEESLLVMWKQAMCTPEGRKVCEELLDNMFRGTMYTLLELTEKVAPYAGTDACKTEFASLD